MLISTAAAVVLTDFFEPDFSFADNTEVIYSLPFRRFKSFMQAVDEAAISRLYGGIHYRAAVADGQTMGKEIGAMVLRKIDLSKHKVQ